MFVHPGDPSSRVNSVHSSRHVRVEIDGVTLGETRQPMLLLRDMTYNLCLIPKLDGACTLICSSMSRAAAV